MRMSEPQVAENDHTVRKAPLPTRDSPRAACQHLNGCCAHASWGGAVHARARESGSHTCQREPTNEEYQMDQRHCEGEGAAEAVGPSPRPQFHGGRSDAAAAAAAKEVRGTPNHGCPDRPTIGGVEVQKAASSDSLRRRDHVDCDHGCGTRNKAAVRNNSMIAGGRLSCRAPWWGPPARRRRARGHA